MGLRQNILSLLLALLFSSASLTAQTTADSGLIKFDFYGDPIELPFDNISFTDYNAPLSEKSILSFYESVTAYAYKPVIKALLNYKDQYKLDDWLYYQLIRKTAQQISPKADNYFRYTLYKWFLLTQSGYEAILTISNDKILFYVKSEENIYNIPNRITDGKQFICLNYHDYGGNIDFEENKFSEVIIPVAAAQKAFSYKVTQLPKFSQSDYADKEIRFNYNENEYHFNVKLNTQIKTIFANYPVVDYESYFNIPLSKETHSSLISSLKKNIKGMNTRHGIDYLMQFTRYAFEFKPDAEVFGNEKRLSPEQTLLYDQSDCEDRAALFFYLVKEIYNLPMIVLTFPEHVTIAVKFDKPVGTPIIYKGMKYSVCEPTPQKMDLKIGKLLPSLNKTPYEVVYAYNPLQK